MGAELSDRHVKQNWIVGGVLAVIAIATLLSVAYKVEIPTDSSEIQTGIEE